jgi:hypothetical protein
MKIKIYIHLVLLNKLKNSLYSSYYEVLISNSLQ